MKLAEEAKFEGNRPRAVEAISAVLAYIEDLETRA